MKEETDREALREFWRTAKTAVHHVRRGHQLVPDLAKGIRIKEGIAIRLKSRGSPGPRKEHLSRDRPFRRKLAVATCWVRFSACCSISALFSLKEPAMLASTSFQDGLQAVVAMAPGGKYVPP